RVERADPTDDLRGGCPSGRACGMGTGRLVGAGSAPEGVEVGVQPAGRLEHGPRSPVEFGSPVRDRRAQGVAATGVPQAVEDTANLRKRIAPATQHGDHPRVTYVGGSEAAV